MLAMLFISSLSKAADTPTADDKSSPPAPQVIEQTRVEPTPNQSQLLDLANSITDRETSVIALTSGEDNFSAFFREQSGSVIKGAVLLFPNELTHPDWPITLNTLRIGLTDFGWGTLSLPLPTPITAALPKRTLPALKVIHKKNTQTPPTDTPPPDAQPTTNLSPPEANQPPADKQPPTAVAQGTPDTPQTSDRFEIIMKRGITAIQWLEQKGFTRIVIAGSGSGATWATALVKNLPEDSNIKLLMLDAAQSEDLSAPNYLELLSGIKHTTLDIYTHTPSIKAIPDTSDAALRLKIARRNKLNNFHQSRLPTPTPSISNQEWLLRYTRGLLETYVVKAEMNSIIIPSKPPAPTEVPPGVAPAPTANKPKPI